MTQTWGHARAARNLLALLGTLLVGLAAFLVLNFGNPVPHFWDVVYCATEFLAVAICLIRGLTQREERRAWILLAIGIFCFACAVLSMFVVLIFVKEEPIDMELAAL